MVTPPERAQGLRGCAAGGCGRGSVLRACGGFAQNGRMSDRDTPPLALPAPVLDIVCLCAAWCGTCREYEATFAELQRALPGHRYRWIDIEDEAELAGDIDVETFPTLMLAHRGQVVFAGPVLPRLSDAQRLVEVQVAAARAAVPAQRASRSAALSALPPDQAAAYAELAVRLLAGVSD